MNQVFVIALSLCEPLPKTIIQARVKEYFKEINFSTKTESIRAGGGAPEERLIAGGITYNGTSRRHLFDT